MRSTWASTSAEWPVVRSPTTCTSTSYPAGRVTPTSSRSSTPPRPCRSCSPTPGGCSPTPGPIRSADQVGGLGGAALEAEDGRVLHPALPDLDRPVDRLVGVPGLRSAHHDRQERQQGLAVLPGRRVPEVRRAVVDRGIVHRATD